jgi:hypothetical protein
MGRIVLAATEMDDWGVDRTVGRLNSLTWSFRRLLTRLVIGVTMWSVGFIERKASVTALTFCTKQRAGAHMPGEMRLSKSLDSSLELLIRPL